MKITQEEIECGRSTFEYVLHKLAVLKALPGEHSTADDMRKGLNPNCGMLIALLDALKRYPICKGGEKTGDERRNSTTAVRMLALTVVRDFLTRCGNRFPACAQSAVRGECSFDDLISRIRDCGNSLCLHHGADAVREDLRNVYIELAGVAADGNGKVITAIRNVAHKVEEHHKENMEAHKATYDRLPEKPRADKGSKPTRKYRKAAVVNGVRLTAKWLAGVLNRSKIQPEKGAGWMGACTAKKIRQWDDWCADHPGERNLWGYITELRTDKNRYDDLVKFCRNWDSFWKGYKAEFGRWRTQHPDKPRDSFRPSRELMKRVDIDPERMGEDEDGSILIRPVSGDEKMRLRKAMCRKGLSRKNLGRQYQ